MYSFSDFIRCVAKENSAHSTFKHGAVIVKGKEIIGVGYNTQNIHAEEKAILDAIWRVLWN